MRLVFLKGDKFAARDGGARSVHVGLGPCQIVAFLGGAFGVRSSELTRCLFNRGKVAACDVGSKPRFLLGGECNGHGFGPENRCFDRKIGDQLAHVVSGPEKRRSKSGNYVPFMSLVRRRQFIDCSEAIMRERHSNSRMPKPVVYDGRPSTPYGVACGDGPQDRP